MSGTTATAIVRRFDAAQLGQAKRTPQGFLRASARLTRTGVLTYKRADGTVCRELRRPEQVFHADSLATLGDAPLTDLHPKEMVSPDNARALSVGHVSHASARADGQYVEADVVVTDAKMIAAVEAGTRREVSCGYKCKLVQGGGVWNGERYDAEQIDIVYNHAGLGPPKWGRAGSEVALRLDGGQDALELGDGDAFVIDAEEPMKDCPDCGHSMTPDCKFCSECGHKMGAAGPKGKRMDCVTIRVDGIDCQVPADWAQVISKGLDTRDAALAASKARLDAVQGELDGTKVKLTEAADPKRFDSAVTERIALLEHARKHLGTEAKLDGLTARAIHELVVLKVQPKAELTGKSDEYVQARFDNIEPPTVTNLDDVRRVLKPIARTDDNGGGTPPVAVPAWQRPLTAHRKD